MKIQKLQENDATRGTTPQIGATIRENAIRAVFGRFKYAIAGSEVLDCVEWADKYRVLGRSSRYRRWSTERTPFLREIMLRLSDNDPDHREIVIMKCSQVGMSEAVLNEMLRRAHCNPCTMLYFTENKEKADFFVSDRLDPAFAQPPFTGRPVRSVLNRREFNGGSILVNGANSASGLSSITAKIVIGDEASRYPASIGGEGDFASLAKGRVKTHGTDYKIIVPSTPRDNLRGEGTFIEMYESGDKREYEVPCAVCGEFYVWRLEHCERDETHGAVMKCPHCGGETPDGVPRVNAVAAGRWKPTQKPKKVGSISYQVSAFIAPPDWEPWAGILDEHAAAQAGRISMQAFYNLKLGLPYDEPSARMPKASSLQHVIRQQDGYKSGQVPNEGIILTAGIDCQKEYLDVEVKAWGKMLENWSVARFQLDCPIQNTGECYEKMLQMLSKTYLREDGQPVQIWLACIDSGYRATDVYSLCARFIRPHPIRGGYSVERGTLTAVKGSSKSQNDRLILGGYGQQTAKGAGRTKHWQVGTDYGKRELYNSLRTLTEHVNSRDKDQPFYARPHFPIDYPDSHFRELVSEQIRTLKSKKTNRLEQAFYLPSNTRNEALDLHVYNRTAAEILGLPEWTDERWEQHKGMTFGGDDATGDKDAEKRYATREKAAALRQQTRRENNGNKKGSYPKPQS